MFAPKPTMLLFVLSIFVAANVVANNATAETVLLLRNGEQIAGKLINPDQSPRRTYIIETASGTRLTLDRKLIRRRLSAAEMEYAKYAPTIPDTAEDQLKLAKWCHEKKLYSKKKEHYRRVIQLDPDQKDARKKLGYRYINGEWMTVAESKQRQGYVQYKNKWVTPQELKLIKARDKSRKAQITWFNQLKKLRANLSKRDPKTRRDAEAHIRAINDPFAVPAVIKSLENEKNVKYKYMYINILGQIGNAPALNTIAKYSLNDKNKELRHHCFEKMTNKKSPVIVNEYIKMLKSKDNRKVNRAAIGLGYLGDKSAIRPLIAALTTKHKFVIGKAKRPGQMTTTFNKNPSSSSNGFGGGGLSMGGRPKIIYKLLNNEEVHATLTQMTGQDFAYDKRSWKHWQTLQQKPKNLDARRD